MNNEKKEWHSIYLILILGLLIVFFLPYINHLGYLPETIVNSKLYQNMCTYPMIYVFKLFYVVMIPLATSLLFSLKVATTMSEEEQKQYKLYYWLISVPVLIGFIFHPWFSVYNMIFLPLILLSHLFIASRAFAKIAGDLKDENSRIGINKQPLEQMGLVYNVYNKQGKLEPLHINNVFQGILVTGGAGAGKSASIIEPAIFQWVQMGCSMTIYDFKGNPATLGLMAYNCWLHLQKDKSKFELTNKMRRENGEFELLLPTFEIISFDNLYQTSRPNPISPLTVRDSIDMKAQTQTFMKGLSKGFTKNEDFWAQAAFALAHAIGERLRKNYPEYCTLPHLIVMGAVMDTKLLVEWLCQDYEVNAIMASYKTAIVNNAEGQIGGMFSSFQQPLTHLLNRNIFWVLGAEPKYQSNLNLNDPENPKIVSISNNPKKDAALSPLISCLLANIMTNINEQGKHPHAFIVDEYPTIYLDITKLPATARSNRVATLAAYQDKSQTESEYGREAANKLVSNLGTQFYGMTNLPENAKPISDMLGTEKKVEKSFSVSDSGPSFSTRLQRENVLQIPDIMDQPKGHFTGKIADGKPAFFHHQFEYFDYKKVMDWKKEIDIVNYPPTIMAIHKVNPDMAKTLFENLVKINYERIKTDCDLIMSGAYAPVEYTGI